MSQPQQSQRSPVERLAGSRGPLGGAVAAPKEPPKAAAAPARSLLEDRLKQRSAPPKTAEAVEPKKAAKTKAVQRIDLLMLTVLFGLVVFGLVMVYSASYYTLQANGKSPYETVLKQGFIAAMGMLAMFALMKVDYHTWFNPRLVAIGIAISLLLLVLVRIPGIGMFVNGSRRWINIPIINISIQPGEIAKVLIVFYLAKTLADNRNQLATLKGFIRTLAVPVAMFALIIIQPNLSTAGALIILSLCLLVAGGAKGKHLALLMAAGIVAAVLLTVLEDYRAKRLVSFLDPFNNEDGRLQGDGYQLYQSLLAIGSGGLFGTGPGMSRQKALYLPYGDSDFIFAVFAEEYGFAGCLLLLGAYGLLIRQGIITAMRAPDRFGSLLAAGLTMLIAVQVVINVAVATGSMPTTGLPLPFFSAGGTNLLVYLAAMGVLLNISKQANKPLKR